MSGHFSPSFVTARDGARLGIDVHDFTKPWLDSDPVVLVHGFSKNRRFWYDWIPHLATRHRVINVDQRAHGSSSRAAPDFEMDLVVFAKDLVDVLDAMNIARANFVIAEFSSAVAVEFATLFPSRVKNLILPGFGYNWRGAPIDPSIWSDQIERDGVEAWARDTVKFRLPADSDPALREWYVTQQSSMQPELMARLFRFAAKLDHTDRLQHILAPTLLLGGSLARQDTAESLRRAVDIIPDCELVMFDGMPFNVMTACPDLCVKATLDFLERHK